MNNTDFILATGLIMFGAYITDKYQKKDNECDVIDKAKEAIQKAKEKNPEFRVTESYIQMKLGVGNERAKKIIAQLGY